MGWWIPSTAKAGVISLLALPLCLVLLGFTGFMVWRKMLRGDCRLLQLKAHMPLIALATILVGAYQLQDRHTEKVLLDELVLQGSAAQLLHNNVYRIPLFSHNLQVDFEMVAGVPDKRPPLYPVMLSLVHRSLGYSQLNGYLLNGLLGWFVLLLIGKIAQLMLPGRFWIVTVLAFGSLPLLSQNVTSQHMEILYLALILGLLLNSLRVVYQHRDEEMPIGYLFAALITMTRYEGLLFMVVPFGVHGLVWLRSGSVHAGRLRLVWWLVPPTMAYIFCLLSYVFANPGFWQLEDMGNQTPFGISYWPTNLGAMLDYLVRADRNMSNSLALSVLGLGAMPLVLLALGKDGLKAMKHQNLPEPRMFVMAIFGVVCAAFLVLIFSYHWGHVNSHVTARFMLFPYAVLALAFLYALRRYPAPTLLLALLFAIAIAAHDFWMFGQFPMLGTWLLMVGLGIAFASALRERKPHGRTASTLSIVLAAYLLVETFPAIQEGRYELDAGPMERTRVFKDWVREFKDQDAIFISDSTLYGLVARESSSSLPRMGRDPAVIMDLVEQRKFSDAYVLQVLNLDRKGGYTIFDAWQLPEGLSYEEVRWRRINDAYAARMVRLTGYEKPLTDAEAPSAGEDPNGEEPPGAGKPQGAPAP